MRTRDARDRQPSRLDPAEVVAREVEVHLLPGDHLTSITKYIEVVGERLKSCLLKAEKLAILTLIQLCPDLEMDLCFLERLI